MFNENINIVLKDINDNKIIETNINDIIKQNININGYSISTNVGFPK